MIKNSFCDFTKRAKMNLHLFITSETTSIFEKDLQKTMVIPNPCQNILLKCKQKEIEAVVQRCSVTKLFLEISQNSQENTCARVPFLLKKRLWHRCFPVNFVKFLRTSFFIEHLWLLLLKKCFL